MQPHKPCTIPCLKSERSRMLRTITRQHNFESLLGLGRVVGLAVLILADMPRTKQVGNSLYHQARTLTFLECLGRRMTCGYCLRLYARTHNLDSRRKRDILTTSESSSVDEMDSSTSRCLPADPYPRCH